MPEIQRDPFKEFIESSDFNDGNWLEEYEIDYKNVWKNIWEFSYYLIPIETMMLIIVIISPFLSEITPASEPEATLGTILIVLALGFTGALLLYKGNDEQVKYPIRRKKE